MIVAVQTLPNYLGLVRLTLNSGKLVDNSHFWNKCLSLSIVDSYLMLLLPQLYWCGLRNDARRAEADWV
jgi:hypothetical protein